MIIVVLAVAGLVLGSFLSVLISRWPQWKGVAAGRSHCPSCMHELAWYDLVPLLSWLMLLGKCRYCAVPISRLYPALELTMAAMFVVYGWTVGVSSAWNMFGVGILACLVALIFFDAIYQMLPDVIVFLLGILVVVRMVWLRPDLVINGIAMGVFLSSIFGLLYLISRGQWLGFGDVKLGAALGMLFGFPIAIGVTLLAIWIGAAWGLTLIAARRATMETAVPFGAFWAGAGVLAMLVPGPIAFLSGLLIPFAS